MKKVRQKKFIGAILNAVGAIAGQIGGAVKAKKENELKEKQYENEQTQVLKQEAQQNLAALQQEANNQQYVDVMKQKITLKMGGKYKNRCGSKSKTKNTRCKKELGTSEQFACGGKTKLKCGGKKKCEYGDRIEYKCGGKKMACGGSKKMACGGKKKYDIGGGIATAINGIGDMISSFTYKPQDYTIKHNETMTANAPKVINPTNVNQQVQTTPQQMINNQQVNPVLAQAKCGKKIKIKRKKCK